MDALRPDPKEWGLGGLAWGHYGQGSGFRAWPRDLKAWHRRSWLTGPGAWPLDLEA